MKLKLLSGIRGPLYCADKTGNKFCKYLEKSPKEFLESTAGKVIAASAITIKITKQLKEYSEDISAAKKAVEKLRIADKFMKKSKAAKLVNNPEKLKKQLMFFAEMADAQNKEEAQEILTSYALPPVTFGIKRETGRHSLLVSGYLTYGAGKVLNDDDFPDSNAHGIYAPVGIEYSYGLKNGSLSLLIAPLDFGYPISLKLNGADGDVDLDELIAPSLAFSYGFSDYPLSIGISYQKGRQSIDSGETEKRTMLFFGIDMPLISIY